MKFMVIQIKDKIIGSEKKLLGGRNTVMHNIAMHFSSLFIT